jgi:hypothetical protein
MMNQLSAMHEAGIKAMFVDDDGMTINFSNGVQLPIQAWLDESREYQLERPCEGGWAAFGSDEVGYGYYPVRLIGDEEWEEQRHAQNSAPTRRPVEGQGYT